METSLEHALANSFKAEMLSYIEAHQDEFDELITLAVSDKHPYSWRAAWLLSNYINYDDDRIKPYVSKVVVVLPEVHDSQKRDLINILRKMEIREEDQGLLYDTCVDIWCKPNKMPSLRVNAFKLILRIAKNYPELYNEVALLTQGHYVETLSPGIKRSIRKLIKSFMMI